MVGQSLKNDLAHLEVHAHQNAISPLSLLTSAVVKNQLHRTPVEIHVVRTKLFYARPQCLPKSNQIIIGLPEKHILNRIHPSYRRSQKVEPSQYVDPDPREQQQNGRHLSKYVFPRQYGLKNPFTASTSKKEAFKSLDYLDRETEIKGFSTSACDWLMPPSKPARQQARVSVSDALKRRELLEEFIFWYFDSFVSSLLKTNFYITETSAFRNRVLYFRHDDWAAMCAPLIERLSCGTFLKMSDAEANEVLRQRRLGFSFVRLLPKDTGVRPIVNLARRKATQRLGQPSELSINQILQATFQILTYEKNNQPARLGASVFGPDDFYSKLKSFKTRLPRKSDGALPHLYFVKIDVQACFDTIEQSKLLNILRELISEDAYMRQKYGQVQMATGYVKRTYVAKALPDGMSALPITYMWFAEWTM
ncbi:hypothetical protein H0H87_010982 [Tephrocybe sp. NHM501043]|nr:hypothetical protein H0H87_010982 [Tephrocybe sp. NHM501043]